MNRKLYNRIMENVSKRVKQVLNEEFKFEHDEMGDAIIAILDSNKNVKDIVIDATKEEWTKLFDEIIAMKGESVKCPMRIRNIKALACYLTKSLGSKVNTLYSYSDEEIDDLADYMTNACGDQASSNLPLNGCKKNNNDDEEAMNSCDDGNDKSKKKNQLNDGCCNKRAHDKKRLSESRHSFNNRQVDRWLDEADRRIARNRRK